MMDARESLALLELRERMVPMEALEPPEQEETVV